MPSADLPFTVVIGLGRSGIGAARLLAAAGEQVRLIESKGGSEQQVLAAALEAEGIEVRLNAPLAIEQFHWQGGRAVKVIVSPGIRWDHPTLTTLRQDGIEVIGEMAVAWEALGSVPWIGITGTNGKTTVTHLISHLLESAGFDAPMCGNVGLSAAELALQRRAQGLPLPDWLVVELSSYQIEAAAAIRPRIGVWTTLTPDHLERHGSLEAYRAIKHSLLERSKLRLLNGDDPDLAERAASWGDASTVRWVTAGPRPAGARPIDPQLWIEAGQVTTCAGPLFPADALAMPGAHNRQNMLLAAAVGLELGLEAAQLEQAFRSFHGVPHRLELIRKWDGIAYYNDSKATNFDAAAVAVRALAEPVVVLAGGEAKQGDATGWVSQLSRHAPAVVLYGAAAEPFAQLLASHGYGGEMALRPGLDDALPLARALAERHGASAVLLSPACASFDQYSDFEARGEHFRALVSALEA
ncbi:UDP-N-acetylmuramoyl-L-alanine--D-glutamate ligase [Synechococcus sp. CS-1325]|uniref:UDP-N-acetylmuramoyl-L-alanine--D-glutamate ligase n=1 Tax=Synechococcus sp. CS-1325 TaxID=2847979 RepID=UPI000DB324D5|nr:UDP-N-acetylmuramoyl-L-alanine--D-glutamate ligase [Synechococcus sp. CS-1325]MCT0200710.1 UDP-N-acetylmuramoyl-L-alanine--D-glutamate ligase [Synechococcus sp. CS-1325]PZV01184.1 MAG: UDP-N-acetylmuramoyl-L-alanine--D-glutamate ligase [Cyanobium sp.]